MGAIRLLSRGEVKDGDSGVRLGDYIGSDDAGMVPLPVGVGGGPKNPTITHRGGWST